MLYYIIYIFIWLMTLAPLRLLYLFSDLIYILITYVFRYRRNVVLNNLKIAFPDKSDDDRLMIAHKFYRHFADHILESFKLMNLSKAALNRRFVYENIDLLNNLMDSGRSLVLVSGHLGNWEWMVNIQSQLRHKYLAIYKPLASKNFDRLVKQLREKFSVDGELVTMKNVYKRILELEKENVKTITWFLADQSPPVNYPSQIKFFGLETPFYSGPAKLARKFNYAVVYLEIIKQSRGYYQARFRVLNDNPSNIKEDEIMQNYVSAIEDSIIRQPEMWLWSHRRWKHTKQFDTTAK